MIVFYNDYVNKAIGINQLLVLFEALAQDAKAGEMKISELFNSSKIIWIYSIFLDRIQLFAQLLGLEEYGTDLLLNSIILFCVELTSSFLSLLLILQAIKLPKNTNPRISSMSMYIYMKLDNKPTLQIVIAFFLWVCSAKFN